MDARELCLFMFQVIVEPWHKWQTIKWAVRYRHTDDVCPTAVTQKTFPNLSTLLFGSNWISANPIRITFETRSISVSQKSILVVFGSSDCQKIKLNTIRIWQKLDLEWQCEQGLGEQDRLIYIYFIDYKWNLKACGMKNVISVIFLWLGRVIVPGTKLAINGEMHTSHS